MNSYDLLVNLPVFFPRWKQWDEAQTIMAGQNGARDHRLRCEAKPAW